MHNPGRRPEDSLSARAQRDLSVLWPALFLPLREFRNGYFAQHRGLFGLAAIGLAPLAIFDSIGHGLDITGAFWCLALYFSAFWLVCFYVFFRAQEALNVRVIALCYFGVSIFSVAVYLPLTSLPPLRWGEELVQAPFSAPLRAILSIAFIGVPEELCKAVALFCLWKSSFRTTPRSMLFYGLVSGLGFGIREGLLYPPGYNGDNAQGNLALYYLTNMLRLTSLPFLHAIWTGIAGYFIGFAREYEHRQVGLVIVAIALPALLHGTYDAFSEGVLGLAVALVSVLLLGLYLHTCEYFAAHLQREVPGTVPQPAAPGMPYPPGQAGSSRTSGTPDM